MSKLRSISITKNMHYDRKRLKTLDHKGVKDYQHMKQKFGDSKLMQNIKCQTQTNESTQKIKDSIYNKNISYFRESFNPNNTTMLPFLSSLRKNNYKQISMTITTTQPFQVSEKETINLKTRKNSNDIEANLFRLSKINYRWNKGSGLGVKTNCQFQCGLRLNKNIKNPQYSTFNNTLKPIRYQMVEQRRYKAKDIICERQKRLFTLQI